jgi:chromosome segregation ATPase
MGRKELETCLGQATKIVKQYMEAVELQQGVIKDLQEQIKAANPRIRELVNRCAGLEQRISDMTDQSLFASAREKTAEDRWKILDARCIALTGALANAADETAKAETMNALLRAKISDMETSARAINQQLRDMAATSTLLAGGSYAVPAKFIAPIRESMRHEETEDEDD